MINFFAIFTIVKFRIREFVYEYNYAILAPLISNLLFVIIFLNIFMDFLLIHMHKRLKMMILAEDLSLQLYKKLFLLI